MEQNNYADLARGDSEDDAGIDLLAIVAWRSHRPTVGSGNDDLEAGIAPTKEKAAVDSSQGSSDKPEDTKEDECADSKPNDLRDESGAADKDGKSSREDGPDQLPVVGLPTAGRTPVKAGNGAEKELPAVGVPAISLMDRKLSREDDREDRLDPTLAMELPVANIRTPTVGAFAVAGLFGSDRDSTTTPESVSGDTGTTTGTHSIQQLTVANLINESNKPLPQAEEIDPAAQRSRQLQRQQQSQAVRAKCCAIGATCILALLVLLLVFLLAPDKEHAETTSVHAPTPVLSQSPTSSPPRDLQEHALSLLPLGTVETIQKNTTSPQARAYEWLLTDPSSASYSDTRLVQRFALATLFYATGGNQWTNNEGWLGNSVQECEWFSDFETACYDAEEDPDLEGLFEDLFLDSNNLNGTIPTELFLMTHLRLVGLPQGSLSGTIPTQVGLMSNMLALMLSQNDLTGVIPVLLPPSLMMIALSDNQLSGPLPTQLGDLARMMELDVTNNSLSGPIPTELGGLTGMLKLSLSDNHLTGSIPEQLGFLAFNHSFATFAAHGNSFSGQVPSDLCVVEVSFDCDGHLCGCNCTCGGTD